MIFLQENHNLARKPTNFSRGSMSKGINVLDNVVEYGSFLSSDIEEVKPYLIPMLSMTEEQKQCLKNKFCYDWDGETYDLWKCQIEIGDTDELIDWFHKNHLDYRGLIPMGLANDATGLNVYTNSNE